MISSLSGRVTEIGESQLTLEIGGVGLLVNVPVPLLSEAQRGQTLSMQTYLVVRENELSLYGFPSLEARQLFILLLGVNGVGPRLALAILSTLNVETVRSAVGAGQTEILNQVPGVGKKTAQKIVLHLADRIGPIDGAGGLAELDSGDGELLEALTGLGYSVIEAQAAIQAIPKDAVDELGERLKHALAYFTSPS
jgi:Holliday junction DNA helicase RuvA